MAKPIGTLGTIESHTVGGRVFTDLPNLLSFVGHCASNARCTMRRNNGTSGYQVTGGKTLTIYSIRILPSTTGLCVATPAQTDNDVGMASSTAFTNPIYYGGDSSNWFSSAGSTLPNSSIQEHSSEFQIAASKYFSILSNSNGEHYQAWGYEA